MRGVFTVVVTTALAIAAVESLSCTQCNSLTNSCINASASECPSDASNSCVSSSANSSLGGKIRVQQEMFCSAADCSGETDLLLAFSVHVSDGERFNFASQCCQEKACDVAYSTLDSPPEDLSSTECPACHGPNATSCIPKPRKCYKEEQCVSLIAQNHDATEMLVLRGCSNISNSICQLLSAGNQRIGIFAFQKVECRDASDQSADFSIDSRASDRSADFSIDSRASYRSADFSTDSPTSNQSADSSTDSPASNQSADSSTDSPASNQSADSSTDSPASNQSADSSTDAPTSPASQPTTQDNSVSRAFLSPLALAGLVLLGLLL